QHRGPPTAVTVTSNLTSHVRLTPVLIGTVRNASGAAVPNTWIYAYQGGPGATCCTYAGGGMTDATGSYNITLPAGTYKLYINPRCADRAVGNGGSERGPGPGYTGR